VNGAPDTSAGILTITPRNWFGFTHDTAQYSMTVGQGTLVDEPPTIGGLGVTANGYAVDSNPSIWPIASSGPNEGYSYSSVVAIKAFSNISVNYAALQDSSTFWFNQNTTAIDTLCARTDVAPFLPKVEAHEGTQSDDKESHSYVYRRQINILGWNLWEAIVGSSRESAWVMALSAGFMAHQPAAVLSDDEYPNGHSGNTEGTVPAVPYCTFLYIN
jgi:hypothetical protein